MHHHPKPLSLPLQYGADAGNATRETLSLATDTARTARNMSQIGPKAILKSTAKKTTASLAIPDEDKRRVAVGEVVETGPEDGSVLLWVFFLLLFVFDCLSIHPIRFGHTLTSVVKNLCKNSIIINFPHS
jgi:hypothetical protein